MYSLTYLLTYVLTYLLEYDTVIWLHHTARDIDDIDCVQRRFTVCEAIIDILYLQWTIVSFETTNRR